MEAHPVVAILMSVRDEEAYIDVNIAYHLNLGFDYLFIANHCSTDNTNSILDSYKDDPRVVVLEETDPVFDHAKIANTLLRHANAHYKVDWFVFLDADEFLSLRDGSIHRFVDRLESHDIPYATIGWANALFDYTLSDYTCSPVHSIDTTKYYYPWPEREWQEGGHFRKAIVKNHDKMEIVVGGHYVRTENNPDFFGEYNWNPFIVPRNEARLLHFEFRGKAADIYKKWEKLAAFERDSTSHAAAPWLERIQTIRGYVEAFKGDIDEINKRWFSEHRTFWGTVIPESRMVYDTTLLGWYGTYVRKKIEGGNVKSICLVRSGNLGDVVMTEPIARFLSKYVDRVCLATRRADAAAMFSTYDKIYEYSQVNTGEIDCEIMVRLVYELSDCRTTYAQGYMASIGFADVVMNDLPRLTEGWERMIGEEYILIAPFTSSWEEKKRSWGYSKYVELSTLLEAECGVKCVLLEKHYAFNEMMSLIEHCKFFIGNDSGPAMIAQSFRKKAFIIFGATRPNYAHMSEHTVPISDENRHALCQHHSRQEEIDCCEEFCMERIRVDTVLERIRQHV